jgi:hypothetical protein
MGLTWQPDWRKVAGTYRGLLGQRMGSSGHGSAPPIYFLATHHEGQRSLITVSSDEELRELFRVLTSGTEAEQAAALDAAFDRVLNTPSTRPMHR